MTQPPAPPRRVPWPLLVPAGIFAAALVVAVVAVVLFTNDGKNQSGDGRPSASSSPQTSVPQDFREYRGSSFAAAVPRVGRRRPRATT